MKENASHPSGAAAAAEASQPHDLAIPALQTALHATAEARVDGHLGHGVVLTFGTERQASLELYPQVVRVTVPHAQVAIPRREPEIAPDGVVFHDPQHFMLSVGPTGDILFQYASSVPTANTVNTVVGTMSEPEPRALLPPASLPNEGSGLPASPTVDAVDAVDAKAKAKSERYRGRLGEVRTHTTKRGKVVAEVELTVADPDRPGASQLVKFVAFGEKAEALQREYQPGQEVTAMGIPHELRRRGKDGREWTERQLYFVQLPKPL